MQVWQSESRDLSQILALEISLEKDAKIFVVKYTSGDKYRPLDVIDFGAWVGLGLCLTP